MPKEFDIVVEDELSDAVLRKILRHLGKDIRYSYKKHGCGGIDKKLEGYNDASRFFPFIVVRDLDHAPCPGGLVRKLLPSKNPTLIFRIVVREIEAWLLADAKSLAKFMGISAGKIPVSPEEIRDPKEFLINLAKSARRNIRAQIVPERGSSAVCGPNYNDCLTEYVYRFWDVDAAQVRAKSMAKLLSDINLY